jgi:integrase
VTYAHVVLGRVLGHAAAWGVITTNVARLVSPPASPKDEEIEILTQDQIGALLRHLDGHMLRPIVSFLLGTGCRRGEALGVRWQDVDLDRGVVRIERSIEQTAAGLRVKAPKTRSGRRNIAISPWLVAELRAHRTRQNEQRLALGLGRGPDDGTVFAQWDGSIEVPQKITHSFLRAVKALGINCTLHGLRHTHVSQLIASGLDILTISRRIGHASPSITLNVYAHMFGNTDAKAAEIMETAFAKVHGR